MNISFINYYPKYEKDQDQTYHSIEYFINPLKSFFENQGHIINQINIMDLNIKPCVGCSDDPFFIPMDHCRQEDDLNEIYPVLNSSEFWFFNIALNQKHLPKQVCNFLDRLEPLFDKDESTFLSSSNDNPKANKGFIYLLSTSEYWGNDIFEELKQEIQTLSFLFNREYLGELLRPHLGVYIQKYVIENIDNFNSLIEKLGYSILNNSISHNNNSHNNNGLDLTKFVINKDEFESKFARIV